MQHRGVQLAKQLDMRGGGVCGDDQGGNVLIEVFAQSLNQNVSGRGLESIVAQDAALRICDVLATDGSIREDVALAAAQTKGNKARTVLFPRKLRDEIQGYLQARFGLANLAAVAMTDTQRALFPTQKNPKRGFTANTLCQLFHKLYKDAQLDGATSHSGRRTFITKLADKGVGVRVLMALAGHKSIATTQRYIELNPTVMKAAVELI